ncbi:MAG: beta-ketoacyl-ACP synthase III [Desulfovermiculus sp.]
MHTQSYLLGFGYYVPERVLSNVALEGMVETSDEWITTRTGIKERRIVSQGQACSDLALQASKQALEHAGMQADELTHILVATFTPDYCTPTTACVLQKKLGADSCMMAMDLAAGCSGFTYGLDTARGLVAICPEAAVLVVGSEVCTSRVNFQDRNTCVLFGDGAGAAIVSAQGGDHPRIVDTLLRADGNLGGLLPVGQEGSSARPYFLGQEVGEDYFIQMKGRELFRHAVRGMAELTWKLLERNGLDIADIDLFIPHQANMRIIEALAKKLICPMNKVYVNVDRYGNTSAASVGIGLGEAASLGRIKPGNKVLLVSFGAGLTWGATLLQF